METDDIWHSPEGCDFILFQDSCRYVSEDSTLEITDDILKSREIFFNDPKVRQFMHYLTTKDIKFEVCFGIFSYLTT